VKVAYDVQKVIRHFQCTVRGYGSWPQVRNGVAFLSQGGVIGGARGLISGVELS